MTALHQPTHNPIDAIWTWARDMVMTIAVKFGDPVMLWDLRTIDARTRKQIIAWLAPLEAVLRRLLLIEALRRPAPPPKPKRPLTIRLTPFLRDGEPARTSFRLFTESRPPRNPKPKPPPRRTQRPETISSRPLARRFNAIVRVLNNPERAIRRIVKQLAAGDRRMTAHCRKHLNMRKFTTIDLQIDVVQPAVDSAIDRFAQDSS